MSGALLALAGATTAQAAASTAFSLVIGVLLGLWMSEVGTRRDQARWAALLSLPSAVSSVVVVTTWGRILPFGWGTVVFVHVFWNVPFVAWAVMTARPRIPAAIEEVARSMGAGRLVRWRLVLSPWVLRAAARAGLQVFALCLTSFAVVLTLGGGPPVQTLETSIYTSLRGAGLDFSHAAQAAGLAWGINSAVTVAGLVWLRRLPPLPRIAVRSGKGVPAFGLGRWGRFGAGAVWVVPYFSIALGVPWLDVFREWRADSQRLHEIYRASVNSVVLAVSVAACVTVLGTVLALTRYKAFEAVAQWPSTASPLILGLGLFWLGANPYGSSAFYVTLIQALVILPLATRALFVAVEAQPAAEREVAFVLGASRFQRWLWVDWPRLRGAVFSVFALGLGVSFAEVGAVSLFGSEEWTTLPLLWGRWISHYDWPGAAVLSLGILVVSGGLLFVSQRGWGEVRS